MMEKRERKLLFERRLRRRRYLHAIVPCRVQHELLLGNVEQIEELEVTVERVQTRLATVFVANEEAFFGKDDFLWTPQPRVG